MKILHVITSLQKAAGTSVFCVELCDQLSLNGINCAIAVNCVDVDKYLPNQKVPIFEVSRKFDSILFKPDLVHIHAIWSPFLHAAVKWAQFNNIPYIVSPHGMLTPWALRQKSMKKLLALVAYQYRDLNAAALLHVTANNELSDVRRLYLNNSVVVAPLGVSLPAKAIPPRQNHPKIVLFVSRIHPKKRLFELVDAWALLKKQQWVLDKWRFVIAGPDQNGHAAQVLARARTEGVEQDFDMIGPIYGKQKNDLYAKADLFVLPTHSENFGVVIIEALSQGCPVITTKGAPWSELLGRSVSSNVPQWHNAIFRRHKDTEDAASPKVEGKTSNLKNSSSSSSRCGWWIEIGVEPLAEAMRLAMNLTDEERRQMGVNGQKLVAERYTWQSVAAKMAFAYEHVLVNKGHL